MNQKVRYLRGADPQSIHAAAAHADPLFKPRPSQSSGAHAGSVAPLQIPPAAERIHQQSLRVLKALLDGFGVKSDDTLFQMAQNASVDQDQHVYFSALRILRLNKASLAQHFEVGLEKAFYNFFSPPTLTENLHQDELSLVEKDVLEMDLAVELMAKRCKQRCETNLLNMQTRFESLCAFVSRGALIPLDPMRLTSIFKQILQDMDLETKPQLVLLKEFERNVLKHLPELIESLNQQLVQMGILPTLSLRPDRYAAVRAHSSSHVPAAAPTAQPVAVAIPASAPGVSAGMASGMVFQQDIYRQFEQWITAQTQVDDSGLRVSLQAPAVAGQADQLVPTPNFPNGFTGLSPNPIGVTLHAPQITPVLTQLQQRIVQNQQQFTAEFLDKAIQQRAGLSRYVHQQLQQQYQQGYHLDHREHNILGLLTGVFAQVLDQKSIPKVVRYALWRLQIPYLKVALQDSSFFVDSHHPARELLNLLADSALKIDLMPGCHDPLLDEIDVIVNRVLQEFDQDLSLFLTLIAEFRGFLASHEQRLHLLQQRLQSVEEGRSRRETAEKVVAACLQQALRSELQEDVRLFAEHWWWKVLFYVYLKEGIDSDAWRRAYQCLQNLVATVLPKASKIDVEIAKQGLPSLIQELRLGLAWVGCEEAEVKSLLKSLRLIHRLGVLRKSDSDNSDNINSETLSVQNTYAVNTTDPIELPAQIPAEPTSEIDSNTLDSKEAVSAIAADESVSARDSSPTILVGEWIELIKSPEEVVRCQLIMHLPSCDKMIFTNRLGMKVLECKSHEFRSKLVSGECRKLQQSALFDQALRQVIELMQVQQQKNWKFA